MSAAGLRQAFNAYARRVQAPGPRALGAYISLAMARLTLLAVVRWPDL
jgi:hypothetical protein